MEANQYVKQLRHMHSGFSCNKWCRMMHDYTVRRLFDYMSEDAKLIVSGSKYDPDVYLLWYGGYIRKEYFNNEYFIMKQTPFISE